MFRFVNLKRSRKPLFWNVECVAVTAGWVFGRHIGGVERNRIDKVSVDGNVEAMALCNEHHT